jgi:hypothetical protein
MAMDENELCKWIITRLGRGMDRNDLLLEVCQKANLSWPEAEERVCEIEAAHSGEIARRQSPVIFILSLGGLLIGLGWAAWSLFGIYEIMYAIKPNASGDPNLIAGFAGMAYAFQYYLPSILGATGLCIGGTAGLLNTLDAWRSR